MHWRVSEIITSRDRRESQKWNWSGNIQMKKQIEGNQWLVRGQTRNWAAELRLNSKTENTALKKTPKFFPLNSNICSLCVHSFKTQWASTRVQTLLRHRSLPSWNLHPSGKGRVISKITRAVCEWEVLMGNCSREGEQVYCHFRDV